MKLLYITIFLAFSLNMYAQENRKPSETQVQEAANYKESKEMEAKIMKEAQQRAARKPSAIKLASEEGLDVKQQAAPKKETETNSGKLLTHANSIEEIQASIPGRKSRKTPSTPLPQDHREKLISSRNLTISDIKKTIPKD